MVGIGWAQMAWKLACERTGTPLGSRPPGIPRLAHETAFPGPGDGCPHCEYYRIFDSATASWAAFAGDRSIGICPRIVL